MTSPLPTSIAALLASIALLGGCSGTESNPDAAPASAALTDTLLVDNAWMRPAPAGGVTALYLNLRNHYPTADTVHAVETPVSRRTELHQTVHNADGTTGMRPLENGLPLPPDTLTTLHPGGPHVMIYDVDPALVIGDSVQITLQLGIGPRTLTVPVRPTPPQ